MSHRNYVYKCPQEVNYEAETMGLGIEKNGFEPVYFLEHYVIIEVVALAAVGILTLPTNYLRRCFENPTMRQKLVHGFGVSRTFSTGSNCE